MRLAFKDGMMAAAQTDNPLGAFFSKAIILATGGKYSHVECVLWWEDLSKAQCFSAIEPIGCRYATIDLTPPGLWTILELPTTPMEDELIAGFCAGSEGKPYDSAGIIGIGLENGTHDPNDRFCSEFATELCQRTKGLFTGIDRWMVAPSGQSDGKRRGLFEWCMASGWTKIQ